MRAIIDNRGVVERHVCLVPLGVNLNDASIVMAISVFFSGRNRR
jgi:hypothetical protein